LGKGEDVFSPDKPISSFKKDILGRHSFAKALGDAILDYRVKDSVVIGLYGAWGSGKTSIINMALEHIEKATSNKACDKKPIIVDFNP
jgi:predicted KAP-like P-loop ATPase